MTGPLPRSRDGRLDRKLLSAGRVERAEANHAG